MCYIRFVRQNSLGRFPERGAARNSVLQADNGSASFCLDVGRPDDLGPLLGFVGDELAEIGGRAHEHCAAKLGEPRLNLGIDWLQLAEQAKWMSRQEELRPPQNNPDDLNRRAPRVRTDRGSLWLLSVSFVT
jgi:hypothetical protein